MHQRHHRQDLRSERRGHAAQGGTGRNPESGKQLGNLSVEVSGKEVRLDGNGLVSGVERRLGSQRSSRSLTHRKHGLLLASSNRRR